MKYLDIYPTHNDVVDAVNNDLLTSPYVVYLSEEDRLDWNSYSPSPTPTPTPEPPTHDYSKDYLTIRSSYQQFNAIEWNQGLQNVLLMSTDGGQTWAFEFQTNLAPGGTVLLKSDGAFFNSPIITASTGEFAVEGNIMSINHIGDDWSAATINDERFMNIFSYTKVVDASNLYLPPTAGPYCYSGMFSGCTGLTTAPVLPATTLANNCYERMFSDCISLVTAPVLPATTLAVNCYQNMFMNCTSLTTAPALPATTAKRYCYYYMFGGCTSLTTAPALPATTLANSCYAYMFRDCTSLTSAPLLPATTLEQYCYSHMFDDCTSLTSAPQLPATTLEYGCYSYMFNGCSNLSSITSLALTLGTDSTSNWVDNVASAGTFTKSSSMNDWTTGSNGIPSGWTVQDYQS